MTYPHEEIDDEVDEDAQLRIESLRDRSRSGDPGKWQGPSPVVGTVACRARCGARVEWSESAEDAFSTWNRKLTADRLPVLEKDSILFCDACRKKGMSMQGDRNAKARDLMREAVRELKDCSHPSRERDLIERIKKLSHPDVEGLIAAIAERKSQGRGRRVTRGDL